MISTPISAPATLLVLISGALLGCDIQRSTTAADEDGFRRNGGGVNTLVVDSGSRIRWQETNHDVTETKGEKVVILPCTIGYHEEWTSPFTYDSNWDLHSNDGNNAPLYRMFTEDGDGEYPTDLLIVPEGVTEQIERAWVFRQHVRSGWAQYEVLVNGQWISQGQTDEWQYSYDEYMPEYTRTRCEHDQGGGG